LKTRVELVQGTVGERPRMRATTAEITNRMIATKKMIFAISTAKPAIPPKPSTAAISAIIRNVKAQPSMAVLLIVKGGAVRSATWGDAAKKRTKAPKCSGEAGLAMIWAGKEACERRGL